MSPAEANRKQQEIRFCRSPDGVQIAYATSGSGPPLVRVTSWLSHLDFDWDSPIWAHWFRELAKGHRLIRYDPRGTGLSDRQVSDLSIEAWLTDLEAVVDDLRLERFHLLGLCQGGPVALAYAATHPERVDRLILYDSYLHGSLAQGGSQQARLQAEALADLIEVGWGQRTKAFHRVFTELLLPQAPKGAKQWLMELQRRTVEPMTAAELWRSFHQIDVRGIVHKIRNKSLVLHVKGDQMVPFEHGRQLAAALQGARFVPLEGANHILLKDDKSWPRLLAEIRHFLGTEMPPDFLEKRRGLMSELTERQLQVLELMAQGKGNKSIADELSISSKTVRNHVSAIYRTLQVSNRGRAIVKARLAGMGRQTKHDS